MMWSKISFLLGIKVEKKDLESHIDELFVLGEWVRENYPNFTIQEIITAYNLAVTNQLGIKELFSILSPKHVGIVLDAYTRYLKSNNEINTVTRLLLPSAEQQQSDEEIYNFMEMALSVAVNEVKAGKFFIDPGNGLFHWLYGHKRIELSDEIVLEYREKAVKQLPALLKREKADLATDDDSKRSQLSRLLEAYELGQFGNDHESRIQSHAKRLFLNDYLKTL